MIVSTFGGVIFFPTVDGLPHEFYPEIRRLEGCTIVERLELRRGKRRGGRVADQQNFVCKCIACSTNTPGFLNHIQVGHETGALTKSRTLDSLYIQPLLQILARQNPKDLFTANDTSIK